MIGFVIVSFELRDFYLIPWDYWQAAIDARAVKKGSKVQFEPMGTAWETTGKASIRKYELPQEWEIQIGGPAGLDYIKAVKRIWRTEAGAEVEA